MTDAEVDVETYARLRDAQRERAELAEARLAEATELVTLLWNTDELRYLTDQEQERIEAFLASNV